LYIVNAGPSAVRRAEPRDHLVQTYSDDAFLAAVVGDYLAEGLTAGEGGVVIATPSHIEAFEAAVAKRGVDVRDAVVRSRLLFLDAERTLSQFMIDGSPDRTRFFSIMAAAFDRVRASGSARIRAFGEMVDLLWGDNLPATVQLEELWNEVLTDERLSLFCAYRFEPFDRSVQGVLHQVTLCHSHLLTAEDPERFSEAVQRAYADVFGTLGDADVLRGLIAKSVPSLPAMATDHAALFALHEVSPALANEVLDRARVHYAQRGVA
jgi:hypothetical protein